MDPVEERGGVGACDGERRIVGLDSWIPWKPIDSSAADAAALSSAAPAVDDNLLSS